MSIHEHYGIGMVLTFLWKNLQSFNVKNCMLYHKSQMLNISYWYEDPTLLSFFVFVYEVFRIEHRH